MPRNIGTITTIIFTIATLAATLADTLPPKYGAIMTSVSITAMMLGRAIVNSVEAIAEAKKESKTNE